MRLLLGFLVIFASVSASAQLATVPYERSGTNRSVVLTHDLHEERACLHDPDQTPEQRTRRQGAIRTARSINTGETRYSTQHAGRCAALTELDGVAAPPERLAVFLTSNRSTHAFAIADEGSYTQTTLRAWNRIKRLNAAAAAAMPESHYGFKPMPDVRSFGEIIGHLANEHYAFCSHARNEANPQQAVDFEKRTAKADLVKAINDSNAYCDEAFAGITDSAKTLMPIKPSSGDTPFSTLLLNVTHDSEHYGNLVTYLRMNGIVPPSSQASR